MNLFILNTELWVFLFDRSSVLFLGFTFYERWIREGTFSIYLESVLRQLCWKGFEWVSRLSEDGSLSRCRGCDWEKELNGRVSSLDLVTPSLQGLGKQQFGFGSMRWAMRMSSCQSLQTENQSLCHYSSPFASSEATGWGQAIEDKYASQGLNTKVGIFRIFQSKDFVEGLTTNPFNMRALLLLVATALLAASTQSQINNAYFPGYSPYPHQPHNLGSIDSPAFIGDPNAIFDFPLPHIPGCSPMNDLPYTNADIPENLKVFNGPRPGQVGYIKRPNTLKVGQTLYEGEYLESTNGAYFAVVKTDGNFVIYVSPALTSSNTIWQTHTVGRGDKGTRKVVLHPEGRVSLESNGAVSWQINQNKASNNLKFSLVMQDDGNLVLYESGTKAVWASNTNRV